MNLERRGFIAKTVVLLLALVVIAGVAWYFTSDVFRTKFDSGMNQLTHWTPENIAKDTVKEVGECMIEG